MQTVTRTQVEAALQAIGIRAGDGLLVHSALQFLGRPEGGIGMYFEALCQILEPAGTIAVPTFTFVFARGQSYDPQATPSQGMGVFSEFVRAQPGARRTPHPMQSLAVVGRYANDLSARDTLSAFDPGSAFERMLELDFKLLLLGADIKAASIVHYSEQRARVPYRYWKDFSGQVRVPPEEAGAEGTWETRTYRMYARDLELDPQLDLSPIQRLLESRSQWESAALNYGWLSACRLVDFVRAADEVLAADPWGLVGSFVVSPRP